MRVVFFGTPEFAVPSLRALVGEGFDVVGVVTQPDAPQGRSRSKVVPPPVKVAAEAEDLTVFQPTKPSDGEFLIRLRETKPDIGVVVAYGHILKPELLELPPRIDSDITGGELSGHLAEMGAQALIETLSMLEQSEPPPKPVPQNQGRATFAPKLTREIARIDWMKDAVSIGRLIRGLDPRPGAWTELKGVEVKLFSPRITAPPFPGTGAPGEVLSVDGSLVIASGPFQDAGGGVVEVFEVQPAGKARMTTDDWLRGARLKPGARFT